MKKETKKSIPYEFRNYLESRTLEEFHNLYITSLETYRSILQLEVDRAKKAGIGEPMLKVDFYAEFSTTMNFLMLVLETLIRKRDKRCIWCGGKLRPGKQEFCSLECGGNFRQKEFEYRRDMKILLDKGKAILELLPKLVEAHNTALRLQEEITSACPIED